MRSVFFTNVTSFGVSACGGTRVLKFIVAQKAQKVKGSGGRLVDEFRQRQQRDKRFGTA
jgi:hypothetical protein